METTVSGSCNVHFLPDSVEPDDLPGRWVVVIDVLRATTTIVQALASGATRIWPCATVQSAQARFAERYRATDASRGNSQDAADQPILLAGERSCVRLPGFDLGNSPGEYGPGAVSGREIAFTTTNGTAAMLRCQRADRILLAAFTNLSAIVEVLATWPLVEIVCSGTDGAVTREDVLLAGALVSWMHDGPEDSSAVRASPPEGATVFDATRRTDAGRVSQWRLNDPARIARAAWLDLARSVGSSGPSRRTGGASGCLNGDVREGAGDGADGASVIPNRLAEAFRRCLGGENLVQVGHQADLISAAEIDRWDVVPEFFAQQGHIARVRGG